MNQKQLQKIRKELEDYPSIGWIETAYVISGFQMKVSFLTSGMLKTADRLGYRLRHARIYSLDKGYLLALFEPKEIEA